MVSPPLLLSPTSPLAPLLHAVLPPASALLTGLGHQVGDDVVHSQWVGERHGHGSQAEAPPVRSNPATSLGRVGYWGPDLRSLSLTASFLSHPRPLALQIISPPLAPSGPLWLHKRPLGRSGSWRHQASPSPWRVVRSPVRMKDGSLVSVPTSSFLLQRSCVPERTWSCSRGLKLPGDGASGEGGQG